MVAQTTKNQPEQHMEKNVESICNCSDPWDEEIDLYILKTFLLEIFNVQCWSTEKLNSINYEKEKQRMCFISCLAHVMVMAAVMQMRQPQEEGEIPEEEKPQVTPWGSLYWQTLSRMSSPRASFY